MNHKNITSEVISVIIPVYNTEKFIGKTLESIQKQTEKNWELIIINDCSTDNSLAIIKNFCKNEKRAKIINFAKNKGESEARKAGFQSAKGKYIYFLDADDISYPDTLKRLKSALENHSNCIASFGSIQRIDSKDKIICTYQNYNKKKEDEYNLGKELLIQNNFIPGNILIKKKAIKEEYFNTNLKYGEDWIFFAHLTNQGLFYYIGNIPVLGYRTHDNQQSKSNIEQVKLRLKTVDILYDSSEIKKKYNNQELKRLKKEAEAKLLYYLARQAIGQKKVLYILKYLIWSMIIMIKYGMIVKLSAELIKNFIKKRLKLAKE